MSECGTSTKKDNVCQIGQVLFAWHAAKIILDSIDTLLAVNSELMRLIGRYVVSDLSGESRTRSHVPRSPVSPVSRRTDTFC